MAGDVLREFLVSVGFVADETSARKAEGVAGRVERSIVGADKRVTDAQGVGSARRVLQANREAGVRTKGAAQIIAEAKRTAESEARNTKDIVAGAKERERASADATRAAQTHSTAFVVGLTAMAATAMTVATKIADSVVEIAGGMEKLFHSSSRSNTSAANMKAFGYAASQLGSSAEEAMATLQKMGEKMRSSPGYEQLFHAIGVKTRDAQGNLIDMAQVYEDSGDAFAKMKDWQAKAFAGPMEIPDTLLRALQHPAYRKFMEQQREMSKAGGLDANKAAKDSADFMQVWRRMQAGLEIVGAKIESTLVKRFGGTVSRFTDWLIKNSDRIAEGVARVGDVMLRIVERVAGLFDAFEKLAPQTKGFLAQIGAMGAALLLLKAGPLGAIVALATAFVALYDDYKKWQEGSKDTLIDWEKWGPGLEKALTFLTSETGMIAAFALLGTTLALKVLLPLGKVVGLLTGLTAMSLPGWLLAMLGIGAVAHAANAIGKGGLPAGVDPVTGSAPGDEVGSGLIQKGQEGWARKYVKRAWEATKGAFGFGGKEASGEHYTGANAEVTRQAAKELGINSKDLAAAISYETGGTFSPSKRGGAGSRHIGLIQFGPAEQEKYGANQGQTYAEQMGAVVRYLKDRGLKPGMDLRDIYSTINAGRPGRYGASDGYGTVQSHSEKIAREHGGRAEQFLNSGVAASKEVMGGFHPLDGKGHLTSDISSARVNPVTGQTRPHKGIDLAAPAGTDVKAMTDGIVSVGGHGDITIKQASGASTTYRHVTPSVEDGARVAAGSIIAQLKANDPRSTGPHLHLEARDKDGTLMDPKGLLAPREASAAPQAPPTLSKAVEAIPKIEGVLQRFDDRMGKAMGGSPTMTLPQTAPLGSSSVSNVSRTNTITTGDTHIKIDGARDPKAVGAEVQSSLGRTHSDLLRNLSGSYA